MLWFACPAPSTFVACAVPCWCSLVLLHILCHLWQTEWSMWDHAFILHILCSMWRSEWLRLDHVVILHLLCRPWQSYPECVWLSHWLGGGLACVAWGNESLWLSLFPGKITVGDWGLWCLAYLSYCVLTVYSLDTLEIYISSPLSKGSFHPQPNTPWRFAGILSHNFLLFLLEHTA